MVPEKGLRSELQPPELDAGVVNQLTELARIVEHRLDQGEDASAEIACFNQLSGKQYTLQAFRTYWEATSLESFVEIAATPIPGRNETITREELIEVVRRIQEDELTESEESHYLGILEANTPHPEIVNLIFWPGNGYDNDPGSIVDTALSYKAIQLPGGGTRSL